MTRQNRSLQPNMRGEDVDLLQMELRQLGFDIPETEIYFGHATSQAVSAFQRRHDLPSTGIVDSKTARVINASVNARQRDGYVVQGRLQDADGRPVVRAQITVLEKRIREEVSLGTDWTDSEGRFEVTYPLPASSSLPVTLVVRASTANDEELAVSDLICSAGPLELVNLVSGNEPFRGQTEYSRLSVPLSQSLRQERLDVRDINEKDVDFLACKFDFELDYVAAYIDSEQLQLASHIEGELFYGLLRQELPAELNALASLPEAVLKDAWLRAIELRIIGRRSDDELSLSLERLKQHAIQQALQDPEPGQTSFAALFDIADVDEGHRHKILEDYINREGTIEDYWQGLRNDPDVPDESLDVLRETLVLSTVSLNHVSLIRRLRQGLGSGELGREVKDLSRFERDEWKAILTSSDSVSADPVGAPAFLGGNDDERIERFASFLPRFMETLYPTAAFAAGVSRLSDSVVEFSPILDFLERNPDFEFRDMRVQDYLSEHENALTDDSDPEQTVRMLQTVQRLFRVAPPFNKAQAVAASMSSGTDSAWAIRRMGASAYIRQHTPTLGKKAAEEMYSSAAKVADTSLYLLTQSSMFNQVWTGMIPPQLFGRDIPDLQDLFGALDACKCRDCDSVLGPSAYLVDILHFLSNRPGDEPGRSALDVLFGRRPDIGDIELTCENSDTQLPYVDLVLEVLENAVINNGALSIVDDDSSDEQLESDEFPFQTIGGETSLAASPEHQSDQAYLVIRDAIFPWDLPFDLWHTEVNEYLGHLRVALHELMSRFRGTSDDISDVTISAELLGISPGQKELITDAGDELPSRIWGLDGMSDYNEFVEDRNVGQLLNRTGLDYETLSRILKVDYIAISDPLEIRFAEADCNRETAEVLNLTGDSLGRLHRFVRLWRNLHWSIESLDAILIALRGDQEAESFQIDDSVLVQLAEISKVQRELRLDLRLMLSWLSGGMATFVVGDEVALYEEVFLNYRVHQTGLGAYALNDAKNELAETGDDLHEHQVLVSRMLGIDSEEFQALIEFELDNSAHNLANLVKLHQATSLAKQLQLSISEFIVLRDMTGIDPFNVLLVDELRRFIDIAQGIQKGPFSIHELNALLRMRGDAALQVMTSDEKIPETFARLREGLFSIEDEHQLPDSPDVMSNMLATRLAETLSPASVDTILGIVNSSSTLSETDKIDFLISELELIFPPDDLIDAWFNDNEDDRVTAPVERARMILEQLTWYLRDKAMTSLVFQSLAESLDAPVLLIESLLDFFLSEEVDMNSDWSIFLNDNFVPNSADPGEILESSTDDNPALAAHFSLFRRLARVVYFLKMLDISSDELELYLQQASTTNWLSPNDIPNEPVEGMAPQLIDFMDQIAVFDLGKRLFGGSGALLELLGFMENELMNRQAFLIMLSTLTDWRYVDIAYLTGPDMADLEYPTDFLDGNFLLQLDPQMGLLRSLSISALTAHRWTRAAENFAPEFAREVKQAVRAKYEDESHWLTVAKPLRDQIREQQRNALVEYLISSLNLSGSHALYDHFLIDVEMDTCMLTTRTALAISTVQLFVHRCLLNLENVELAPKDAEEWRWMQHYREWEVARKGFVYTENFISPELRVGKTHIFQQLEQNLLQGEVNDATADQAFGQYLNGLKQISKLSIVGVTRQWEVHQDVLHVFGRSKGKPHTYFYRRWVDQRYWTPWERIELEIEGNHLVPVFWEGRLLLIWPIIVEKAGEPDEPEGSDLPPPPKRYHSVSLAWSELRNGHWMPSKISDDTIETLPGLPGTHLPHNKIQLWPQVGPEGNLYVLSSISERQFRFDSCACSLEANVRTETGWKPFKALPGQYRTPFQGTNPHFDYLREDRENDASDKPLEVISAGDRNAWLDRVELKNIKTSLLLRKTPGRFKVTLPAEERLYISRSPLFYSDSRRCFLVVPKGRYTGGFASPDLGLLNPSRDVPLELPGTITRTIASAISLDHSVSNSAIAQHTPTPLKWEARTYRFDNHYLPFTSLLLRQFEKHGVNGVLKPDPEKEPQRKNLIGELRRQNLRRIFFVKDYRPNPETVENVPESGGLFALLSGPTEEFDFTYSGAYSAYNWELFFHVPFLLALRLSENKQFAAAQRWFHYIFDPTDIQNNEEDETWPTHVWQIQPFVNQSKGQSVQDAMLLLSGRELSWQDLRRRKQLLDQIEVWRKDPYRVDLLAEMRPVTLMKAVVMAYLDNLIAWSDHLFRIDTRESLNQATQLLLLAERILGERPVEIDAHKDASRTINGEEIKTFNQLRNRLDDFSNALVVLESQLDPQSSSDELIGPSRWIGANDFALAPTDDDELGFRAPGFEPPDDNPVVEDLPLNNPTPAIIGPTLFFCIPKNDKLIGYWDLVANRLYNLRHCMNIDGIIRQVAPFSPSIDPELLFKARAANLDIRELLEDRHLPLSNRRFQVLMQKAVELCSDVRSLGSALLVALEKKDAESLSLIRAEHETSILEHLEKVRMKQRVESLEQKQALLASRRTVAYRYKHHETMLGDPNASTKEGATLSLRWPSRNTTFDNFSAIDFESSGEDIDGVNLQDIAVGLVNKIVSSTGLGKIRKGITQGLGKLGKKVPVLGKVAKVLDRLPTATELTERIIPENGGTLDGLYGFIGESDAPEPEVTRVDYLDGLDSLRMLMQEKGELKLLNESQRFSQGAGEMRVSALWWNQMPSTSISVAPFGLGITTSFGGSNVAAGASANSERLNAQAGDLSMGANMSAKVSQYILRKHDWAYQSDLAALELMSIDKQLIAAETRIAIADDELANHRKQIKNTRESENFLRDKFTDKELYNWMTMVISDLYFKSYDLAYDMARKAEQAFRFELGVERSQYIKSGSWDSLKKGLLAGEILHHDLKRLELAYMEEDRRELELSKYISLAQLNPFSLMQLKDRGRCEVELPEALFDSDYPGHYFRRIKSVALTIPAVTGPYVSVSCTLRLLHSSIRRQSTLLDGRYPRDLENGDQRFNDAFGTVQSIATSSGDNDTGMFELNFRDERYLPFEGAGVISRWQLEMADDFRQFDYESISDVIVHIRYTARDGGSTLREPAANALRDVLNEMVTGENAPGLHQSISARHEFPTAFHQFLQPQPESGESSFIFELSQNRFPFMFRDRSINIGRIHLILKLKDEDNDSIIEDTVFSLIHPEGEIIFDFSTASGNGELREVAIGNVESSLGEWQLTLSSGQAILSILEDIMFVLHYQVE